ncbi:MAG: pyruvate, phosphate dikinase, partial [Chloroflexi bacterium]|nr:pyruvate, phosphate dikinase [Chloroflexota bacterium]
MTTTAPEGTTAATNHPPVFRFGAGNADGDASMGNLLGGKGAGLAEMSSLGIPVPPGFTITTEVCNAFYALGRRYPDGLVETVREAVAEVGRLVGAGFGDADNPLLVSVRSGARVSMPGMMDTVLNLGLNDETAEGLARRSGSPRFAYDSYRRFVQMYGDVVLGVRAESDTDEDPFEALLERKKHARGVELDTELDAAALRELVTEFKAVIASHTGLAFPDDPWEQLWGAIGAVFNSWENPRAVVYRELYGYPSDWGTAVNVQAMVFGNLGEDCATGVVFTRDPATGERRLSGEYLINAQGEDVVAGIRTPQPLLASSGAAGDSLEELMPEAQRELAEACERLERHFRDMQDIEFTVQQGRLWVLQTRSGKRTGQAMVKIAVDLVDEGLINEDEAVARQEAEKLDELLHPTFDPAAERLVIATGLGASPGAAVGRVVFSAEQAAEWADRGEEVVLVRIETSPEDLAGMQVAQGILTARGGATSHAAVVARGMGKCCVAGCGALAIDYARERFSVETPGGVTHTVNLGDTISIDGTSGEVLLGAVPLVEPSLPDEYRRLMGWADSRRRLGVRANADTPEDAAGARAFGAEGIGLCRTEHMFFGEDRI